jgi:hypothetical protein
MNERDFRYPPRQNESVVDGVAELLLTCQVPLQETAILSFQNVSLTAPPPVPTASTKQEHNQDDNQNRF